ncbi:MAG: hypothetical protein HYX76_02620 [Acidobacteria bacterium]|nr:hypothetical protein [Acidobacteriota bacterium]
MVKHIPKAVLIGTIAVTTACSGSSSPSQPSPPGGGTSGGTTITITASGVVPKEIQVSPGSRVTFVNNDTRQHDMASDPHPDHSDCPEINSVGFLQPGRSGMTDNLVTVRTCGYHDHDQPFTANLQGRIVIR